MLVVHCSDTPDDESLRAIDIQQMHLGFGWDGVGYHRIICRNGVIEYGRPDYWVGAHVRGFNDVSLGVCLIGRHIFTDAQIEQAELQGLLSSVNEVTFNAITVDSDTSTSDSVLVAATGASQVRVTQSHGVFRDALHAVMLDLAHQVVRDGEGGREDAEDEDVDDDPEDAEGLRRAGEVVGDQVGVNRHERVGHLQHTQCTRHSENSARS